MCKILISFLILFFSQAFSSLPIPPSSDDFKSDDSRLIRNYRVPGQSISIRELKTRNQLPANYDSREKSEKIIKRAIREYSFIKSRNIPRGDLTEILAPYWKKS